jgi:UDP-N-acetyl-2-amino-2-deoxyglucuronate dehydrogenase
MYQTVSRSPGGSRVFGSLAGRKQYSRLIPDQKVVSGMKNFSLIGSSGYIAPRHLQAIKDTNNRLVSALDKSDSAGVLDRYFDDVLFFTEFERFDRHAEKIRRLGEGRKIHYVSICSPNYLHDAHIRFALRIGAEPICEKPLVLNPWNLDALQQLEEETGHRIYNVLQLRLHPALIALRSRIGADHSLKRYDVELTYITPRGNWYFVSWKGSMEKSGGLATNIGIHFFDMLIWIFGKVLQVQVHHKGDHRVAGYLELERAHVRWYLSLDKQDVLLGSETKSRNTFRSIRVDGQEIEFSEGFADLHTQVYRDILSGGGFGVEDARASIQLAYQIRHLEPTPAMDYIHPFLSATKT